MVIYRATNLANSKVYIGKTKKSLEIRKREHLRSSKMLNKSHFYHALNKYGPDKFKWEIIDWGIVAAISKIVKLSPTKIKKSLKEGSVVLRASGFQHGHTYYFKGSK